MKILQVLKNKAGKLPITVAQAAGLTAVVGAAGFAALNFLSGPSDTNNTFVPSSAYEQGNVVYVAQGPSNYNPDDAPGSTFKVNPSRSIRLANEQDMQQRSAQELENFTAQPTFEDPTAASGEGVRAHQLSGADMNLGMGGNKQIGNSFEILKNMPDQLNGLGDMVANAQAAAQTGTPGAAAPGAPAGTPGADGTAVPTLANASRNFGGGMTRAGGGSSGSPNAFVIQDSGKNKGKNAGAAPGDVTAQTGDAIAQARAAMTNMREGQTLTSRANFGPSDKMGNGRDASVQKGRNFGGKGRNELAMIRKQSAALSANRTNTANAGATPFLAGNKISGGLVVSEDSVVIGQTSSSGDLSGRMTTGRAMKGIQARLDEVQATQDEQKLARDELKSWLWKIIGKSLIAIVSIAILVALARAGGPWAWAFWAAAGVATAKILWDIWKVGGEILGNYNGICGADKWTALWWVVSGVMTAGVGLAWTSWATHAVNWLADKLGISIGSTTGGAEIVDDPVVNPDSITNLDKFDIT